MEILGRKVEAVQYGDWPLVTAYVRLKGGDCIKERKDSYRCLDTCENSLVIVRFIENKPFSVKALVIEELEVNSSLYSLRKIRNLDDLNSISKKPGYVLRDQGKHKILFFNNKPVVAYTPCGIARKKELFSKEVKLTIASLTERVSEIYSLSESRPFEEAVLDDRAVNNKLFDPVVLQAMSAVFGKAGADLVERLRLKKVERN